MRFETAIDIAASAEHVFGVYADVERWPEWTQSVTSVEHLDEGALRTGSRVRIKQPRLPSAVWEVTDLVADRSFTWVARGPGVVTTASHVITPDDQDHVTVTASLDQEGLLGPLLGLMTRKMTNHYLESEVRGLKARCET